MVNEHDNRKENTNNKTSKTKSRENNGCKSEDGGAGDVVADFIEDVWEVMTPEMLERLRCVLTEDMGLSKKDADEFIQSQRAIRKQRICLKKDRKFVRIGPRNQWIKELSRDIANPIASALVGILLSKRTARTKKITEKILERLCDLTGENTTVNSAKTRIEKTLVVVADRMATYFDEAITDMEREMEKHYRPVQSFGDWERQSLDTLMSTETSTLSERDELDKMSESEIERLLTHDEKKRVKVQEQGDILSEDITSDEESDERESKSKEESEEVTTEDESEVSVQEEEEVDEEETEDEESSAVEEEEAIEEEEMVEEEEEIVEEEEAEEEEAEEEETEEEEEEEEGEKSELDGDKDTVEEEKIEEHRVEPNIVESKESAEKVDDTLEEPSRTHLDILELLKEDIERTSKDGSKTDRQIAVKNIIEKRFEAIAKEKLDKSIDSIVRFDIDETASIVANWLEKILPSGDISAKLSLVPSLIKKQGSAFEITVGKGSQYEVNKVSSTTVAAKVADVKGIEFPVRRKKLPRSMSPINSETTKDWADWALEAANVGEEWGKWLDKALDSVEERFLQDKAQIEQHDEWKTWKDSLEHEAQQWRAEKHKIKGEAYLWNKKIVSGKTPGPEKETNIVNY
ncbi:WD repeat-containing protein 87-like [Macrosteles quadrilineatus]|uniref:WD repeat-containing protein 87-like n=1 Tax=Macrosteles quadrilineatus TaxID=74068 RepID=UPI0023E2F5F2|nr:WD repeat-containing protein 87-like [Macrosteles quadrilineatus]